MALSAAGGKSVRVAEIATGQEVSVSGRLDENSVTEVRAALHDILDRGVGDLLVHLAQADVADATGLGVIVGVHHRARRVGRQLVLVDVSPRFDRVLRGSRLNRVLTRGSQTAAASLTPVSAPTVGASPVGVAPATG